MENVSLLDVVSKTNGKVVGKTTILDSYVQEVVTDSRVASTNGLFFAIVGENTDGHNYISMAKENGAIAAV
jgi:UDP-N-acetylmuramoyl-tripeptide--D-alanyl-D-alanine ligase